MAKKRRLRKKQLKQDTLVTLSVKASTIIKRYFNQIIIGIAAVVIAVAFFMFTAHARRQASLTADKLLGNAIQLFNQGDIEQAKKAFTQIADQYSRVQPGIIALYFKGECDLRLSNYSESLPAFEAYIRKSKKYPLFKEAAIIGKALALEGTGNYLAAATLLEHLLKEMDEKDPRYIDVMYRTAIFYSKLSGYQQKAEKYFSEVAEKASGRTKEQARVAAAILKGLK